MICPKCNHNREDTNDGLSEDECPNCGVIYSKCLKTQKVKSNDSEKSEEIERSGNKKKKIILIVAALSIAGVFLLYVVKHLFIKSDASHVQIDEVQVNTDKSTLIPGVPIAGKKIDMVVFGIPLGEPFTVGVCKSGQYDIKIPCYRLNGREDINLVDDMVEIRLPQSPPYIKFNGLHGFIFNGNLEGFRLELREKKNETALLNAMKEKFGEPTSYEAVELQNGLGVKFNSFEAAWDFDNLSCFFSPATDSNRYVKIYTKKGLMIETEIFRNELDKTTKL